MHAEEIPNISLFKAQLWAYVKEIRMEDLGYNLNTTTDFKCAAFFEIKFVPKSLPIITSVRWSPRLRRRWALRLILMKVR